MKKIYVMSPNVTVIYAAEELKKYMRMMMPDDYNAEIQLSRGSSGFRLGLMSDFGLDTSDADDITLDDIIYVDCDESGGIISGSNPRSVLLAVYEFLRRNGCRWLYPGIDGEYIPLKSITPVKCRYKPSMRYRGMCDEGAASQQYMIEAIDFYPKLGLNMVSLEFFNPIAYYSDYYNHTANQANRRPEPVSDMNVLQWRRMCETEIEKRGLIYMSVGHGWTVKPFGMQEWGDPEKKKLPEEYRKYMAELGGVRGTVNGMPHITNVCMSNPEARRRIVECAADYAERHSNISYLSINYADGSNRHCECESCSNMLPSDWLVKLLNEIDAEFVKRNLNTRIVTAIYEDTCWAPISERLNNPRRFMLTDAMIWRDFTKAISPQAKNKDIPPYIRNKNNSVKGVDEHMTCAKHWREREGVKDIISFDYHFWRYYYFDIGSYAISKIIYEDVKNFEKNGFSGMVEDASQRSYFPNGFALYIYARTLFNTSLSYDEITEEYFSCAYGKDWKIVLEFFKNITNAFSYEYVSGNLSKDAGSGNRYNPDMEKSISGVAELVSDFRIFLAKEKKLLSRVSTVSYRLLTLFCEYCEGMYRAFVLKCRGENEKATEVYTDFIREFGKYELEIERYYDHSLAVMSFDTYSRIFKGAAAAESAVNVF